MINDLEDSDSIEINHKAGMIYINVSSSEGDFTIKLNKLSAMHLMNTLHVNVLDLERYEEVEHENMLMRIRTKAYD